MKWFNRSNDEEEDYPLEAEQSAKSRARGVKWLLYLSLLAVVLTTAAHAILLVMSSTDSFTLAAENGGLFYMILAVLRVGWPVIIEIVAVAVGVGFLVGLWRGGQEGTGSAIEIMWFLFAAANMVTFFAIERGETLQGWQKAWVTYGLPISALLVAAMTYQLLKNDPAFKRRKEASIGEQKIKAAEHNARMAVKLSPAMRTVHARKVWREEVKNLESEGYTPEEIAHVAGHIPDMEEMAASLAAAQQESRKPSKSGWRNFLRRDKSEEDDAPRHEAASAARPTPGQGEATKFTAEELAVLKAMLRADLEKEGLIAPAPAASENGHPNA